MNTMSYRNSDVFLEYWGDCDSYYNSLRSVWREPDCTVFNIWQRRLDIMITVVVSGGPATDELNAWLTKMDECNEVKEVK